MTTFAAVADPGTTVQPEDKALTSPGPLSVEESPSADGREAKEAAQLASASGETSVAAPGPASSKESAGEQVGDASRTAVDAAVAGAENTRDSVATAVAAAEGAENGGDSTMTTGDYVQQGLSVSVSVEEPARAAAATPRVGTAGKSVKPAKRLSLIARQSSQGAVLRRKNGLDTGRDSSSSGEVVPKGGERPASRRTSKPATAPKSAGSESAKTHKRVSLIARQASAASARLRGGGSGSDSGTANYGVKPASKADPRPTPPGARSAELKPSKRLSLVDRQAAAAAEPRNSFNRRGSIGASTDARDKPESETAPTPSLAKKTSARTAGQSKPRRTSLVDRQAAAAAELRNSNSRRGSIGSGSTAGDNLKSAAASKPGHARKKSPRTTGENKPRRFSLVERQAAAAAELRSKLASREAPEGGKPTATASSPATKGVKATKAAGKRASFIVKQSAESSSSTGVEAKSITSPANVEDCPEVSCEPTPIPESPKSKEDTGVLPPTAES
eukprot:g15000.t1